MRIQIPIPKPSEKQDLALRMKARHCGYGGARGGGKSWTVRTKAKLLCAKHNGIKCLIVRRTYPELTANHISILRTETLNIARYNDRDKILRFKNGSTISFRYCARDSDLDAFQGQEYDVIFLDEATQLSEHQMKVITACCRGVNDFPKRIYYTCNPGGQGHAYIKRIFIDRRYEDGEEPSEYEFVQALVQDNDALMKADPEYVKFLEGLPPKLKEAWLYGRWDIFEGMYFEEFRDTVDTARAKQLGVDPEDLMDQHRWTHVIHPFNPPLGWKYYRSYDWGYGKPFSCNWWAVDYEGTAYMIAELYGSNGQPNEGIKWNNDKQFSEIARIEREHPYLKGREIFGVADPSIWDGSKGVSTADTAEKYGIYFDPGVNDRIPGWMQMRYRFQFDDEGYARMYFFETCKDTIRTLPLLMFDEHIPEDLDSDGEDHAADSIRYFCMSRPIEPMRPTVKNEVLYDPLDLINKKPKRYGTRRY